MDTTRQSVILVGVDGSQPARRALRWAVEEGRYRDAQVRAVIGWTYVPFLLPGVYDPPDARRHAERMVEQEVAGALAGLADPPVVLPVAVEGPAAQVLTEASADAAMLVVGSHGHGAIAEALLGSVSAACVRHAACPVVVVPPEHQAPPDRTHHSSLVATPLY
jgi:nucleotide-binding universal stress UspA family protein